jgi:hypothetical protein
MSKFYSVLAMAVLGIAMLMGAASAGLPDSDTCDITACVLADVAITVGPGDVGLGNIPAPTPVTDNTMKQLCGVNWEISAADANAASKDLEDEGYMMSGGNALGAPITVNTNYDLTDGAVVVASGSRATDCAAVAAAVPLTYQQDRTDGDAAGSYTITILYTISEA